MTDPYTALLNEVLKKKSVFLNTYEKEADLVFIPAPWFTSILDQYDGDIKEWVGLPPYTPTYGNTTLAELLGMEVVLVEDGKSEFFFTKQVFVCCYNDIKQYLKSYNLVNTDWVNIWVTPKMRLYGFHKGDKPTYESKVGIMSMDKVLLEAYNRYQKRCQDNNVHDQFKNKYY